MSETHLGLLITEPIVNTEKYRFLAALAEDYPEIAKVISERIPEWRQKVDAALGLEGFADQILQTVEYKTKKDELAFCQRVATQITKDLESYPNKKICFIQWGGRGSEPYFHKLILEQVPAELKQRIVIWDKINNRRYDMLRNDPNILVYYIDDSANSGQQINSSVISTFEQMVSGYRTADLQFTAFLMGMTKTAQEHIAPFLKNNLEAVRTAENDNVNHKVVWQVPDTQTRAEFNFSPTPTMHHVVDELIKQGKIPEEDGERFLIAAHHSYNVGTLLLFYHRLLQDNVPSVFTDGRLTQALREDYGINPLFEGFEDINAYDSSYPS